MQNLIEEEKGKMLSANIALIQVEVKALYSALLELLPDVETFENEFNTAKTFLSPCEDYQQSILERMLVNLKFSCTEVAQVKVKVTGIREDVQILLTHTSSYASASQHNLCIPVQARLKVENTDDYYSSEETSQVAGPATTSSGAKRDSENTLEAQQTEALNDLVTSMQTQTPTVGTNKCRICGEKIHSRFYHMRKYHPGMKFFPCETCGEGFDSFKDYQNHIKAHTGAPLLKCDLCNSVLTTRQGMVSHMKSHIGNKPYTCDVCGKGYRCRTSVVSCTHGKLSSRAIDIMKYQSGFQCKTCGMHFATKDAIYKPEGGKSNTGGEEGKPPCVHSDIQKIFYCNLCPKFYTAVRKVRYHMNIHMGIKLHNCDSCGEKFLTSLDKKKHVYEKHGGECPGYKCRICGKICRSILGRESHYLDHTAEERSAHNVVIKMAECDICGKTVRRNALPNHKLIHSTQDSFICEVCGKGFKRKASLKQHVKVHMNPEDRPAVRHRHRTPGDRRRETQPRQKRVSDADRIFKCDICSKYLSSRQSLQQHELVHTKVKAYKCNLCSLSFSLPGNLKRHYIIHTGQKPFQCDFCGKGFVQKNCLDIHRRVHTGEKPYQCNHCGKRFSDPSTLYKHKAKHEKDNMSYHLQSL
ncbi:zinc finger protein 226 [Elysia marginata]|uniref:Zinc finger protein 226 n=1 Tax=Elysia marginata TaxID=1093978 RepID=A0AAV4EQF7_9GAST|nr:zinc finger protein 226 [Elysia marginata]